MADKDGESTPSASGEAKKRKRKKKTAAAASSNDTGAPVTNPTGTCSVHYILYLIYLVLECCCTCTLIFLSCLKNLIHLYLFWCPNSILIWNVKSIHAFLHGILYVHMYQKCNNGSSLFPDILLLYDGSYREPTAPAPHKKQTNPPSISISELYTDSNYPKGMEMSYTVRELSQLTICTCTIIISYYCVDYSTYVYVHVGWQHCSSEIYNRGEESIG